MYVVGLNAKDMILMYMAHSVVKTCIFIQSKNGEKSREQPWRNLIVYKVLELFYFILFKNTISSHNTLFWLL